MIKDTQFTIKCKYKPVQGLIETTGNGIISYMNETITVKQLVTTNRCGT